MNDEQMIWEAYTKIEEMAQKYTSASTSINSTKLPSTFNSPLFDTPQNSINVDLGGGRFDNATEALKNRGITNLIIDPYNRTKEFNDRNEELARKNPIASVTVNNVLNVIMEPEERENVIKKAKSYLKQGGKAFFLIYYKTGKQAGETSKGSWQNHMLPKEYVPEIRKYFSTVKVKGNLIIAE
jgi:hypothetical protein